MTDWIKAANPTAPITTEPEALGAARASAIAIFIGFLTGAVGLVWQTLNPQDIDAVIAQAGATDPQAASVAAASVQAGIWLGVALVIIQLILGVIQWRNPNKILAILFIVLVAFGIVMTAAAPLLAGMVPNVPATPGWQIALSLVILVIQMVLLIAGLRGIGKLDAIQMSESR